MQLAGILKRIAGLGHEDARLDSQPRDRCGRLLYLDDTVFYREIRYQIVAMSHGGKVCIRHPAYRRGGRWVGSDEVDLIADSDGSGR